MRPTDAICRVLCNLLDTHLQCLSVCLIVLKSCAGIGDLCCQLRELRMHTCEESWSCFDIAVVMVLPATTPPMVYVVMVSNGLSLISVSMDRWVAFILRFVMDLT